MASQYSDLNQRVLGVDMHAMALALAYGQDPASVPLQAPSAGKATSFVYRVFDPAEAVTLPTQAQSQVMQAAFPDALLFPYPRTAGSTDRDFKWLGSYRFGIMHLGGCDQADLRDRRERASALLGWAAPYADPSSVAHHGTPPSDPGQSYSRGPSRRHWRCRTERSFNRTGEPMKPKPPHSRVLVRTVVVTLLSAALLGVAGCGAMSAQNPRSTLKPVNVVEMAPDARVML